MESIKDTTGAKGSAIIFNIMIQDSSGTSVDTIANSTVIGKDVSYLHLPSGEYSLRIVGANVKWSITVEQQ